MEPCGFNRRDMLKTGLALAAGGLVAGIASPAKAARMVLPGMGSYAITFTNAHTGEGFSGVYRVGNRYLPEAFEKINYVLRDFRVGEVFPIDPRALDIVYLVHQKTGVNKPLEILSGYRSPKTNSMLRRATSISGVAVNSLHLTGQAIDFRMPEYSTRRLRNIAASLNAGGVGFYPRSNFVHVDTGSVRHWG